MRMAVERSRVKSVYLFERALEVLHPVEGQQTEHALQNGTNSDKKKYYYLKDTHVLFYFNWIMVRRLLSSIFLCQRLPVCISFNLMQSFCMRYASSLISAWALQVVNVKSLVTIQHWFLPNVYSQKLFCWFYLSSRTEVIDVYPSHSIVRFKSLFVWCFNSFHQKGRTYYHDCGLWNCCYC